MSEGIIMRIFIAIEGDDGLRRQASHLQRQLEPFIQKGNATAKGNFHITLRFIGDIEEALLPMVQSGLESLALHHESFDLSLDTLGEFTNKGGKVIWLGASHMPDALGALASDAEKLCRDLGLAPDERPYTPHLTLYRSVRIKAGIKADFLEEVMRRGCQITHEPYVMHVSQITLMHSTRQDDRLVYLPLTHYQLKG